MLELYLKYQTGYTQHNKKKQIWFTYVRVARRYFFLQKILFNKLNKAKRVHLKLFFLYKYIFSPILIKKKKHIKKFYFKQFQQYIY